MVVRQLNRRPHARITSNGTLILKYVSVKRDIYPKIDIDVVRDSEVAAIEAQHRQKALADEQANGLRERMKLFTPSRRARLLQRVAPGLSPLRATRAG